MWIGDVMQCGANPVIKMMRRSTEIPRRESRFTNYVMCRINAQKFEKIIVKYVP